MGDENLESTTCQAWRLQVPEIEPSFWSEFVAAAGAFAIGEVFNGDLKYVSYYQKVLTRAPMTVFVKQLTTRSAGDSGGATLPAVFPASQRISTEAKHDAAVSDDQRRRSHVHGALRPAHPIPLLMTVGL
jgi:hypothetical protein